MILISDRHNITENLESLGLNWSSIQSLLNPSSQEEPAQAEEANSAVVAPIIPKLAAPRGSLVKHRENEEGPRICGTCNASFDSLQELAQHMKNHLKVSEAKSSENDRTPGKKRGRGRPRKCKRSPSESSPKKFKVDAPMIATPVVPTLSSGEEERKETAEKMHEIKIVDVTNVLNQPEVEVGAGIDNLSSVISIKSAPPCVKEQSEATEDMSCSEGNAQAGQSTEIVLYVTEDYEADKVGPDLLTAQAPVEEEEEQAALDDDSPGAEDANDLEYVPPESYSQTEVSNPTDASVVEQSAEPEVSECGLSKQVNTLNKGSAPARRGRRGQITKNCTLIFDDSKRVMYKCNFCPLCFSKLEMFSRHLEECHKSAITCDQCFKQFETKTELSYHICEENVITQEAQPPNDKPESWQGEVPAPAVSQTEEGEEEGKVHKCDICEKTFERLKYLKRHLRGHTNIFHCSKCNKRFVRKETLQNHACDTGNARPGPEEDAAYACEFCGVSFQKQKYLLRHMAAHTGEFRCNSCNREFSRKESLLQHIKKFHPEEMALTKERVFPCDKCNRVFSREVTLVNHMKLHKGTHTCDVCGRSFASGFSLEKHTCGCILKTDTGYLCKACNKTFNAEPAALRHQALHSGEFTCQICHCPFSRKELLNQHLLVCTAIMQSETSGEIVCNICEKNFPDAASFRVHYQDHTHPYKCGSCEQRFLRIANLRKHRCKELSTDKTVECQICKKKFKHERFLQRHMVLHNAPKYHCLQCNRKFGRIDFYNDHMCVSETGERVRIQRNTKKADLIPSTDAQAICPTCGKSYSSVSNLNKHMKTHGEKKEFCDICNKSFHLKIALREHMESVHTEVFKHQCQYCGKFLKCRNSMFGHVRQFHSDITIMYECEQCGKQFRQKGNLKKHILTHSAAKTFECKECSKKFKFPDQLKRHEVWHTQGERFQCEFCYKKFVMQFELRKHQQTYHSGIMYVCEYCFTECRHAHTMKRHLQRRHSNEREWQSRTAEYIKSLIPQHRLKYVDQRKIPEESNAEPVTNETIEAAPEQDTTTLAAQLQAQIQDPNLPLSEQPFIVAEVSGLGGSDADGTQTVIIQTSGNQFDNEMVSQEVAAALRSLTKRGTLDESTFAIIQNLPSDNTEEVTQLDLQDTPTVPEEKPYIVVPMMNPDGNDDTMNVFNSEMVQDQIYTEPS